MEFFYILYALAALYLIFAFVEPPSVIRNFLRVPGIFVFLPEQYRMKAGRIFTAVLLAGVAYFFQSGLYLRLT